MEDQYVALLERVLTENRRLREAIEARDNEQRNVLRELASKMETGLGPERPSRKITRKIQIPQQCRQDLRKMYKALKGNEGFKEFELDERFLDNANKEVTHTVIEAVVADHGGTDKCPWSAAEMKGAAATYFKSLCDASKRAKNGKQEDHRTLCRRQGRMRDKIERRLTSLKNMPWSEEKKAMVEVVVGIPTFTSSDESDFSDDENGAMYLAGYQVKKLPWERSALTKAKKALDDAYIRSLNPRARVNLVKRLVNDRFSTRLPPGGPEWAVRSEEAFPTPTTAAALPTHPPQVPAAQHRACHSTRTPPTQAHPSSAGRTDLLSSSTSPPTVATQSHSTHRRSAALPSQTDRLSSSTSTSTSPPSMATQSHSVHRTVTLPTRTCPPVVATPSPSTLPSAAPSLTPGSRKTPRTSKKKSVKSKKNSARRLTVSPVY